MDNHDSQSLESHSEMEEQSDVSSYGSAFYIQPEVNTALSNVSRASEIKTTFPTAPEDVRLNKLFGFQKAKQIAGTFKPDVVEETLTPDGVVPHRIFVNHVDSYFGKHFVKYLSTQVYSFPRADGELSNSEEEEGSEEDTEDEVEEEEEEDVGDEHKGSYPDLADKIEEDIEEENVKEERETFGDYDEDPFACLLEEESEEETEKNINVFPEDHSEVNLKPVLTADNIGNFNLRKLKPSEYQELLDIESEQGRLRFLNSIMAKRRWKKLQKKKARLERRNLKHLLKKIKYSKTHKPFEVFGTLQRKILPSEREDSKLKYLENVRLIDDILEDRETFLNVIMTCGIVVFNVTPCENNQAELAKLTIQAITGKMQDKELNDTETFKQNPSSRTFLLISPMMTWASTVPLEVYEVSEDAEELPFLETDLRRRSPHENFKKIYRAENETLNCGQKFETKLKTLVVNTGILYGHEEEVLDILFLHTWRCETDTPLFDEGKNLLPLIHVDALCEILYKVIRRSPFIEPRLIFAMERKCLSLQEICQAISALGMGNVIRMHKENSFVLPGPGINQVTYDYLTNHLNMEPKYLVDQMDPDFHESFVDKQELIMQEYIEANKLQPLRILIDGLPLSGKTTLAMKLCSYYNLYYLNRDTIVNLYREMLSIRARDLKAIHIEKVFREKTTQENEDETEEETAELAENIELKTIETKLKDLWKTIYESNGELTDDTMLNLMTELLEMKKISNVGYVLDGWPNTYDLLQEAFNTRNTIAPNVLIKLNIEESICLERIYNLPDAYWKRNPVDETILVDRLFAQRKVAEPALVSFFQEDERKVQLVNIDANKEINFCRLSFDLGKPRPEKFRVPILLGQDVEVGGAKDTSSAENVSSPNEADVRKAKLTAFAAEQIERRKRAKEDEDAVLAVYSERLRQYAGRYLMPTLSRGLMEVVRTQPPDPVDFLAEYLFRHNPEGRMLTDTQKLMFGSAPITVDDEENFRELQKIVAKHGLNRSVRF